MHLLYYYTVCVFCIISDPHENENSLNATPSTSASYYHDHSYCSIPETSHQLEEECVKAVTSTRK